jgi:transcriptional regulator with XRE-family HTH domain
MKSGIDVGTQLRSVRVARGLSQRELAKRAGVTNGMISLIEQNRVSPSVSSLNKVLGGIPMTLAEFFAAELPRPAAVFYRREELAVVSASPVEVRLVAAERAPRTLNLMTERYAPGVDSGSDSRADADERFGIVIKGAIEVVMSGVVRRLSQGDAYYFPAGLPYRLRNVGATDCEIISAAQVSV